MQQTLREEQTRADRSFRALFSDLGHEVGHLIRQEAALAKAELSEKVGKAGSGLTALVVGGLVAYAGLLVLLAALTVGIFLAMDGVAQAPWLAPLIVGLITALVGLGLVTVGRRAMRANALTPRRTLHSLHSLQIDSLFARDQLTREQYK